MHKFTYMNKTKITEEFVEELLDDISDEVLLNSSKSLPAEQEQRIYSKMLKDYKSLNTKTMVEDKASNWMKSLIFLFTGAAMAMLAVVAFNYWQSPQTLTNAEPEDVAIIEENNEELVADVKLGANFTFAEGQVQIKKGTEWINVEIGETVSANDLIQTKADSKAIITFDDGSILRLDENTYIEVEEANNKNIIVKQVNGQTYSRVHKSHTFEYKIKSLDTTVTALGTAFTINRNHGDDVILKVLESKVKVEKENIIEENDNIKEDLVEIEKLEEVAEGESYIYNATTEIGKKDRLTYEELQDDFYTWNKEEDTKENKPLGFLEEVPPVLVIEEPTNEYSTFDESIIVKGYTDADAKVTVNEKEVELKEGKFEQAIILEEGENKINIKSVNKYNKETEELLVITRKIKTATTPSNETKASIYISGSSNDGKVYLKWSLRNLYSSKGYKVVVSENAYPVYPGNTYHYKSSPSTTSDTWSDLVNGKTYHFRVCEYLGNGKCGTYSNDIKVTVKGGSDQNINGSIKLNGAVDANGKVSLTWSLNNMTSEKGYKVVQNKTGSPVYPGSTYHYKSDANTSSDIWTGLTAGETYHFRVCEYLGGKCGIYSNEIVLTIPANEEPPVQTGSIYLHGVVDNDGKVNLDWSLTDMTSEKGFKVVYNQTGNPVYPGSTYHYLSSPDAVTDSWTNLPAGETYYFRVCEYLGGSCGVYSNQITITVPALIDPDPVQSGSISLSGSSSDGIVDLNWSLNSMTSDQGFKVVYNIDGNPVYPGDPYHYLSNPSTRFDSWSGFTIGETYYFRVCEYLGGSCGVYSNQIAVTVE